jgi:hypothetical protein
MGGSFGGLGHFIDCHAEHREASSEAMAWLSWAQILRPPQDDKTEGRPQPRTMCTKTIQV